MSTPDRYVAKMSSLYTARCVPRASAEIQVTSAQRPSLQLPLQIQLIHDKNAPVNTMKHCDLRNKRYTQKDCSETRDPHTLININSKARE